MHMPDLIIRIKKKTDGEAALTCERADGSVTWQRQEGQLGRFFPLHDLTHFAVESVLGFDARVFRSDRRPAGTSGTSAAHRRGRTAANRRSRRVARRILRPRAKDRRIRRRRRFRVKIVKPYARRHKMPTAGVRDVPTNRSRPFAQNAASCSRAWRSVPPGETLELRFQ